MKSILISSLIATVSLAYGSETIEPYFDPIFQPRTYKALAELETGNNDFAVGKAGEVSRYQIMPYVWSNTVPININYATNNLYSQTVARMIIEQRRNLLRDVGHPTPFEIALLWHRPGHLYKHTTQSDNDYATRYSNLWYSFDNK